MRSALQSGLIGGFMGFLMSFLINYFFIPLPETVAMNALGNGISWHKLIDKRFYGWLYRDFGPYQAGEQEIIIQENSILQPSHAVREFLG